MFERSRTATLNLASLVCRDLGREAINQDDQPLTGRSPYRAAPSMAAGMIPGCRPCSPAPRTVARVSASAGGGAFSSQNNASLQARPWSDGTSS